MRGQGTVFQLKTGKWRAVVQINGKNKTASANTKREAEALLPELWALKLQLEAEAAEQRERERDSEELEPRGGEQCLAALLDHTIEYKWRADGCKGQRENAARLVRDLGPRLHPSQLTKKLVSEYFLRRLPDEKDLMPSTVNRYMSALRVMLRVAYENLDWVEAMPYVPTPLPEPKHPKFTLTADECYMTINELMARGHVLQADIFKFLVDTGCRIGEALDLRYDHISGDGKFVTFWDTKTDEPRTVPVSSAVRDRLHSWKQYGETYLKGKYRGKVFPIRYRGFHEAHMEVKHVVCDALGKSDIERALWVTHTLRKTGLTFKAEGPECGWKGLLKQHTHSELKQVSGHSNDKMVGHYINGAAIKLAATVD